MPLILPKSVIHDWVNPNVRAEELLSYAITDMVAEKAQ
jgi:hypothetical protein